MASGAVPLRVAAGGGAAALLLALTLGSLVAVALRADGWSGLGPADWAAVRFTLVQATLSAGLSIALAVPVARALARRRFRGRGLVVTLMGAPFILPVIVAVFGLLAVFGRGGLVNAGLAWAGLPPVSIYGLHGVVLAHVFFNMPLAVRLILQGWLAVPAERFRTAAALGFGPAEVARWIERPILREVVPGAFAVIFLLCMSSFAVALTLGGGPGATTVELAIYQAFRFEFDLGKAALLSLVQVALCGAVAGAALSAGLHLDAGTGLDGRVERWDAGARWLKVQDAAVLGGAALFLALPLSLVIAGGLAALPGLPGQVWAALLRSLAVALASAALTLALALAIADRAASHGRQLAETVSILALAVSPLVIGTGLFIVLFPIVDPSRLALPVTALVNAALSVPFALRALIPALRAERAAWGPLAASLGMPLAARLRLFWMPRLRRPLGFSAGLAAALSMGDLGVVTLFADPERGTLPLAVYRLMGAYRMEEAGGAALLLLLATLALFWAFDRGGRVGA